MIDKFFRYFPYMGVTLSSWNLSADFYGQCTRCKLYTKPGKSTNHPCKTRDTSHFNNLFAILLLLGTTDSSTRKLKVTKLIEGHDYNFKVFAENEIGESDPCANTEPIKARLPFGKYLK